MSTPSVVHAGDVSQAGDDLGPLPSTVSLTTPRPVDDDSDCDSVSTLGTSSAADISDLAIDVKDSDPSAPEVATSFDPAPTASFVRLKGKANHVTWHFGARALVFSVLDSRHECPSHMLVPAYGEDEDALRRTIDSIREQTLGGESFLALIWIDGAYRPKNGGVGAIEANIEMLKIIVRRLGGTASDQSAVAESGLELLKQPALEGRQELMFLHVKQQQADDGLTARGERHLYFVLPALNKGKSGVQQQYYSLLSEMGRVSWPEAVLMVDSDTKLIKPDTIKTLLGTYRTTVINTLASSMPTRDLLACADKDRPLPYADALVTRIGQLAAHRSPLARIARVFLLEMGFCFGDVVWKSFLDKYFGEVEAELQRKAVPAEDRTMTILRVLRRVVATLNQNLVAGVAGRVRISQSGDSRGLFAYAQAWEFTTSQIMSKAAEAWLNSVSCLPGCFVLIAISAVMHPEIQAQLSTSPQSVMETSRMKLGEDRFLTALFQLKGWVTLYEPGAMCESRLHGDIFNFILQRRRWDNSTVAVNMFLLKVLCHPSKPVSVPAATKLVGMPEYAKESRLPKLGSRLSVVDDGDATPAQSAATPVAAPAAASVASAGTPATPTDVAVPKRARSLRLKLLASSESITHDPLATHASRVNLGIQPAHYCAGRQHLLTGDGHPEKLKVNLRTGVRCVVFQSMVDGLLAQLAPALIYLIIFAWLANASSSAAALTVFQVVFGVVTLAFALTVALRRVDQRSTFVLMFMFTLNSLSMLAFIMFVWDIIETLIANCGGDDPMQQGTCERVLTATAAFLVTIFATLLTALIDRNRESVRYNVRSMCSGGAAFLLMMPIYLFGMKFYAYANFHEVSWGTRPASGDAAGASAGKHTGLALVLALFFVNALVVALVQLLNIGEFAGLAFSVILCLSTVVKCAQAALYNQRLWCQARRAKRALDAAEAATKAATPDRSASGAVSTPFKAARPAPAKGNPLNKFPTPQIDTPDPAPRPKVAAKYAASDAAARASAQV